jgi:hypothetical protein
MVLPCRLSHAGRRVCGTVCMRPRRCRTYGPEHLRKTDQFSSRRRRHESRRTLFAPVNLSKGAERLEMSNQETRVERVERITRPFGPGRLGGLSAWLVESRTRVHSSWAESSNHLSGDVEKKGAVVRFRILSHSHALFGTLAVVASVHGRRPTERVTTLPHPGHSKVCISEPSWRCQSGSTRAMVISCRDCLQVGKFNAFPSIDGCGFTGPSRSARTSGCG